MGVDLLNIEGLKALDQKGPVVMVNLMRFRARHDHRHRQGAIAKIGIPAAAVAIKRARAKSHQVHHHDRPLLVQRLQALDIQ